MIKALKNRRKLEINNMSKYVIVSVSQEYNDDITCLGEDGGIPVKIFDDKTSADAACLLKNALEFQGLNVREYCYELKEILDRKHKLDELKEIIPNLDVEDYELILPDNLSLDQLKKVAEIFSKLQFYKVYEVDSE